MATDIVSMGSTQQVGAPFGYEVEKAPLFVSESSHAEHTPLDYPTADKSLFDTTEQELMADFFSHPDDAPRTHFMVYNSLMMGNPPFSDHRVHPTTGEFSPRMTFDDSAKVNYTSPADELRLNQVNAFHDTFTLTNGYSNPNNDQVMDSASSLLDLRSAPSIASLQHGSLDGRSFRNGAVWGNLDHHGLAYEHAAVGTHDHVHHRTVSSDQLATTGTAPGMFPTTHEHSLSRSTYAQALQMPERPPPLDLDWPSGNAMRHYMPNMPQSAPPIVHGNGRPSGLLFGADPNFGIEHYNAPHSAINEHDKATNLLHVPLADQAANSHSLDHQRQHRGSSHSSHVIGGIPLRSDIGSGSNFYPGWSSMHASTTADVSEEGPESEPLRKRRRTQAEREEDEEYTPEGCIPKRGSTVQVPKAEHGISDNSEEALTPSKPSFKRRKSSYNRDATTSLSSPMDMSSPAAAGDSSDAKSRRKSIGKAPRQNLTDEQKRQNHIASEQKRRNVIKQGYAELERLVPGLNDGKSGLSRSDQVREIWQYVARLVQGNNDVFQALNSNFETRR